MYGGCGAAFCVGVVASGFACLSSCCEVGSCWAVAVCASFWAYSGEGGGLGGARGVEDEGSVELSRAGYQPGARAGRAWVSGQAVVEADQGPGWLQARADAVSG